MSWKYISYISKKVFFEILDNSFNSEKELIVESKEKQKNILLELQKYIESFTPQPSNSWQHRFEVLKESLSAVKSYNVVSGRTVLEHYCIMDSLTLKDYIIAKIITSSHARQEFYMVIFFYKNKLFVEFPIHKSAYRNNKKLEELIVRFDKYETTKEGIILFIDVLMEKQKELEQKAEGVKLKKEKISTLKSKAIIAKVKEIMKGKEKTYRFVEKRNKIILIIKLSQSQVMEIAITYNKFHNTLQKLSELVDQLVELHEQGIEVKHKQTNGTNQYKWISNKE